MKKKNREATVFSLSAIDLFCSALGVFMILCFIVFPFYRKESPPTPQQPTPAPQQPTPTPAQPTPEVIVQKQVIAGLTVALSWTVREADGSTSTRDDIDLHVDAPGSNGQRLHYYYKQKTHTESPARLVTDSTRGGNEVWLHPRVTPGIYKISYVFYSTERSSRQDTLLTLRIISGEGEEKTITGTISGRTQPDHDRQTEMAIIQVNENGEVTFPAQ